MAYIDNQFDHLHPVGRDLRTPFNRVPVFSTMGRGPRGEKGEKGDKGSPATIEGEIYTKEEVDDLLSDSIILFSKTSNNIDVETEASGLSVLLVSDDNYILYDCGATHSQEFVLDMLVQNLGENKLDGLIISHYHDDHIGNFANILSEFCDENTKFYLPVMPGNASASWFNNIFSNYNSIVSQLQLLGYEYIFPINGDIIENGKQKIEFINCGEDYTQFYDSNTSDYNDYSICVYIESFEKTFFLTGDASYNAQEHMLNNGLLKKCDGFLIPHHGANPTDSSSALLEIGADIGVVSNSINVYNNSAVSRFSNGVAELYLTSVGADVYTCGGNENIKYSFRDGVIRNDVTNIVNNGRYSTPPNDNVAMCLFVDSTFDGESTGSTVSPYKTFLAALNHAERCQAKTKILFLFDYTENNNIKYNIPDFTIIDANGHNVEFSAGSIRAGRAVEINGIKFTHQLGISDTDNLNMNNCSFESSSSSFGLSITSSNVKLKNCDFKNNQCAIYESHLSHAVIEDCIFDNCDYLFRVIVGSILNLIVSSDSYKPQYNVDAYSYWGAFGDIVIPGGQQIAYPVLKSNKNLSTYSKIGWYYSGTFSELSGVEDLPTGIGGAFILHNFMQGGSSYQEITTWTINSSTNNGKWIRQGTNDWIKII